MSKPEIGSWGVFRAYGDELIVRRIVDITAHRTREGEVLVASICRGDEYDKAQREGRTPICVGFRMEYFVRSAISSDFKVERESAKERRKEPAGGR